jgi:hypothetical protein
LNTLDFFACIKAQFFRKFSIAAGFARGGYHNSRLSILWSFANRFAFTKFPIDLDQTEQRRASIRPNMTISKIRTNFNMKNFIIKIDRYKFHRIDGKKRLQNAAICCQF